MSLRPFRDIKRKKTKEINVGDVKIGGNNPISVQTMTNTLTTNVKETIKQINACAEEGAELVRVSCPDEESTNSLKEIVKEIGDEYTQLASEAEQIETYVDTGSYIFNGLVSGSIFGGVSGNKITAIAGESSTGKTFFSLAVVKLSYILLLSLILYNKATV